MIPNLNLGGCTHPDLPPQRIAVPLPSSSGGGSLGKRAEAKTTAPTEAEEPLDRAQTLMTGSLDMSTW